VVAFEANPIVLALARELVAANRSAACVRFVQACVGERSGAEVDFFVVAGRDSVVSSRSRRVVELFPAAETIRVRTLALDDLTGPPPRVIKIDIEGGEYAALEGAATLVERHHPHLIIETHPRMMRDVAGSLPELCAWLVARGYHLVDLRADEPTDSSRYVAQYSDRPAYLLASTTA
jgi:FkbM family methyltransferase